MNFSTYIKHKITRLAEYEFWPYPVFYFPMLFYGLYLAVKSRSLTYFTATNPTMKHGGVMGESKLKILTLISRKYLPETLFIRKNTDTASIKKMMLTSNLRYPIIAKPDIGERGTSVEKISDDVQLEQYVADAVENILLQEFVDYPVEAGVLYYRYPGEKSGNISSVVLKDFLKLEGNGLNTIDELIDMQPRAFGRRDYLKKKFGDIMSHILGKGEKLLLEPIGNHCRGTTFLNGNHLINADLVKVFDEISAIEGFYYGRFDIKAKNIESLHLGVDLKVLELNGVSSEPAHIYDPQYKLTAAYRDLMKHMKIIYEIAKMNSKNGVPRESPLRFFADVRLHLKKRKKISVNVSPA